MGLEDDLFNALKYANLGGKADPLKMMSAMLHKLETTMLMKMQAQIQSRLDALKGDAKEDKSEDFDPFTILGVKMDATQEEVTKAYHEKAHKIHPDKSSSHQDMANRDMAKVNAAFEAIKLYKGWK